MFTTLLSLGCILLGSRWRKKGKVTFFWRLKDWRNSWSLMKLAMVPYPTRLVLESALLGANFSLFGNRTYVFSDTQVVKKENLWSTICQSFSICWMRSPCTTPLTCRLSSPAVKKKVKFIWRFDGAIPSWPYYGMFHYWPEKKPGGWVFSYISWHFHRRSRILSNLE